MDDREVNYTRKMYEYAMQQQQYVSNSYDYKYFMPTNMNSITQPYQVNGMGFHQNGMIPMPNQITRPVNNQIINGNNNAYENKGLSNHNLGFQMNPVSKNRKK